MGSREREQLIDSPLHVDNSASGLLDKHNRELEHLSLTNQPLKTVKFFSLAVLKHLQQFSLNTIKCSCLVVILLVATGGILLLTRGRAYEETLQPVQELLSYLRFGLWWLVLGVASSIGLGSGLHTFVLYLGPHIALFSIKCVSCGRVDIKSAPYDTIQLRSGPSWLDKDCSEFGPPLFSLPGARVPLTSILHQVQLEAILWGIGTALGELPPYFISRAASISGSEGELMEDLDSASKEDGGIISNHLKQIKKWLLSNRQYLNFFTILVLASDQSTGQMIGTGHESQSLYYLTSSNSFTACSVTDPPDPIRKRLGHPSLSKLQKMVPSLSSLSSLDCELCQLGKHTSATFSRSIKGRFESIFSLVHSDIWGPSRVSSTLGFRYFVSFIDD